MKAIEINEEEFKRICNTANNMAEAARLTGLHPTTFRHKAKALGCYKPNQNNRPAYTPRSLSAEEVTERYLSNNKNIYSSTLRKLLIKHGFKDACCELCGLSAWRGKPIPLELHHIDGDRYNNKLDNLRVLCPTCHSWLTQGNNFETEKDFIKYIPRKTTPKVKKEHPLYTAVCPNCNKEFQTHTATQKYCSKACAHAKDRRFEISAEDLLAMFKEEANYTKIAKKLGVSDNAVKKRCKTLGIYEEVKMLIDEEKRIRALINQGNQDIDFRKANNAKSLKSKYDNMDYYVGYTIVDGKEIELVRFENSKQVTAAGYSLRVIQRVCNGYAKSYKGWYWRRESK